MPKEFSPPADRQWRQTLWAAARVPRLWRSVRYVPLTNGPPGHCHRTRSSRSGSHGPVRARDAPAASRHRWGTRSRIRSSSSEECWPPVVPHPVTGHCASTFVLRSKRVPPVEVSRLRTLHLARRPTPPVQPAWNFRSGVLPERPSGSGPAPLPLDPLCLVRGRSSDRENSFPSRSRWHRGTGARASCSLPPPATTLFPAANPQRERPPCRLGRFGDFFSQSRSVGAPVPPAVRDRRWRARRLATQHSHSHSRTDSRRAEKQRQSLRSAVSRREISLHDAYETPSADCPAMLATMWPAKAERAVSHPWSPACHRSAWSGCVERTNRVVRCPPGRATLALRAGQCGAHPRTAAEFRRLPSEPIPSSY